MTAFPLSAQDAHETDVRRLAACHDRLRALFATDLAAGGRQTWRRTGERPAVAEHDLSREVAWSRPRR